MFGICSYGGYVPRYRLNRGLIYAGIGWMNAGNIGLARGEKAVANFDEDSITMGVAAGIDALTGIEREKVEAVYFASTTLPYKERLNAAIIAGALGLEDNVRCADFTGALKSGTSALISAMESVESGRVKNIVVTAADCRLGKPASPQEMIFGDAAAAFVVGSEDVIAEFKNSYSVTMDFGDHYRGSVAKYDRQWEDRWIRDLGFDQFVPTAVNGLLEKADMAMADFAKVVYPCHYPAARKKLNKVLGIAPEQEQSNLQAEIGESGTPHSLVMLAAALEDAKPGDKILVVSYGSGCDAICLEVTENILNKKGAKGISGALANRADLDNYTKLLVWRDILPADFGLRMEEDAWTRWSALYRMNKFVNGLWGTKCQECGTPQIPPQRICVNPDCGAVDKMDLIRFSDKTGKISSFTADNLAASYDPPSIYGQVEFDGGGKFMFDFSDCNLEGVKTDMEVTMSFRRKYYDEKRDISGYFWKAVPVKEAN